ncbi:outer membrane protein assembly factor BamB [Ahniella affigens]|uniref:Outer membrane protein assembly factor BamB n=1 Tax=Ahniella affigens TaxID=2021234 RepID=A0A2P1PTM9_9GAMM|nr:outer membrane protein assembly factor BamB [Ahniella affigens]AVP98182.1 outer membrane protein assembly factor BamB [Ahniella affigens]
MRKLLLLSLIALTMSACTTWKKKENIDPPNELVEFTDAQLLKKLWSTDLGDGSGKTGAAARPYIVADRLYATDVDNGLYALDASTGNKLFQVQLEDDAFAAGPVADSERVLAGTLNGKVLAYDAGSASELWQAKVSSEVLAAPVIAGDIAVVRCNDGRIFGLDLNNGSRKWVFDRGLPLLSVRGYVQPLLIGDILFVGYETGKVVALRVSDGSLLWEQAVGLAEGRTELQRMTDVDGELVVDGDRLYAVNYRGQVVALSPQTGRPIWNRDLSSYTGVSKGGDQLYVADDNSTLWALDANDGSSTWQEDAYENRWLTTPVVAGDYLLSGDIEGYLHVFARTDGSTKSRVEIADESPIRASPLIDGNRVYVQTSTGELAAYELNSP